MAIEKFESVHHETLDSYLESKSPDELRVFIIDAIKLADELAITIQKAQDVLQNGYGEGGAA